MPGPPLRAGRAPAPPLFEIAIDRPGRSAPDAAQSVYRQLAAAIRDGRLCGGSQLPSTRSSASYFGVSRNTAAKIYQRLLDEGLAVARRGSGTYVAERTEPPALPASRQRPAPTDLLNPFWSRPEVTAAIGFWRDPAEPPGAPRTVADFRPALIDSRHFPFDVFRSASAGALRALERRPARFQSAQGNQGNRALREAICRHVAVTRAVVCQPGEVLVTSGAQQAFDLLARVLVKPGETVVALEDPGYPPMRVPFAAAGAKVVPVGVDDEGIRLDQIPPEARVIGVCPSHQFPLGMTMSPARRLALLELARRRGAVVIEDDYDGEFHHEGSPVTALRGLDAADVVFYVGTFSKSMLPALRLGFLVAPAWATRALVAAKNAADWHCPTPLQLSVAAFLSEGHLVRHVRRMRALYQRRRRALLRALEEQCSTRLIAIPSSYGLHVTAVATAPAPLEQVTQTLLGQHVRLHTLARYFVGPETRSGLVFGLGAVELPAIERCVAMLRRALGEREHRARGPMRRP
jgi:GntR family transcriptional regulator/MocR family aminotransferase